MRHSPTTEELPRNTKPRESTKLGAVPIDQLAQIEVPVLVAAFEQDTKFPPRGARLAASLLPRGQVIEIHGAAHGGLLTHTQDTFDALVPFLLSSREREDVSA